jgi:L-asparaginase II
MNPPIICEVLRSSQKEDVPESLHRGHIAVVDGEGRLLFSTGSPSFQTFARSVLKPFQLVAVIESGAADYFSFSDRELAIMAGSHSGSAAHLEVVQGILAKIGLDENALECGAHLPRDPEQSKLISEGKRHLCQLHNNCSGKNSGMLSICRKNGWDYKDYKSLSHKVQQFVLGKVIEVLELPALEDLRLAVDGCGVPTPYLQIKTLAMGFARLAGAEGGGRDGADGGGPGRNGRADRRTDVGLAGRVSQDGVSSSRAGFPCAESLFRARNAMAEFPEMVAGEGRVCTAIIRSTKGRIIAKGGGEGIYCVGNRERGIGICLKVEDGSARAVAPTAIETMRQLGLLDGRELEELKEFRTTPVTNHIGKIVGEVRPCFTLEKCV